MGQEQRETESAMVAQISRLKEAPALSDWEPALRQMVRAPIARSCSAAPPGACEVQVPLTPARARLSQVKGNIRLVQEAKPLQSLTVKTESSSASAGILGPTQLGPSCPALSCSSQI